MSEPFFSSHLTVDGAGRSFRAMTLRDFDNPLFKLRLGGEQEGLLLTVHDAEWIYKELGRWLTGDALPYVKGFERQGQSGFPVRTDEERLDWFAQDNNRLENVRGRMNNEDCTLREAIDWFMDRG